jgi:hypothetical protein
MCVVLGTLLEQPTGHVLGQLNRPPFEDIKGRQWLGRVRREHPVKDGLGVFEPLVVQLIPARCGGTRHGRLHPN